MIQSTRRVEDCIAFVRERLGNHWIVGAPLGLGKPNHLVNALYLAACKDPEIRLELFTALSLNPPKPASGLKQRFLGPFVDRHFGGYPRLAYLSDLDRGRVPPNVTISEFYFRSGSRLGDRHAQAHYVSSNYTHVARDMRARGINLLVQMVAIDPEQPGQFSLSCNPDVTLELLDTVPKNELLCLAQTNPDLPWMDGDAVVADDVFDLVLEDHPQRLFAVPRMPVSDADYLIGLHVSQLVRDGGTLQLGIGSLGDAVSFFTRMRHQDNRRYRALLSASDCERRVGADLRRDWGGDRPFEAGLYAASEMFMEGFLHLYRAGVLSRQVYDHEGLQRLINQGRITPTLDSGVFDALQEARLLPARLGPEDLAWLRHFGIVDESTTCDEHHIRLPGSAPVANDLDRPATRSLLSAHARGRTLRHGAVLHAAFFLGSQWMYDTLNAMSPEERALFQMTSVARVNQLYRGEALDRVQRQEARLINTTMKMSLLGAAASDQLESGQVVSGVGGQYNFVAMAHALERSRSILMLRSCRDSGTTPVSNLVWEFPHATIPRHLRDLVVTEYGVADLRAATDEECIRALICVADSRWQEKLRGMAVAAGKLDAGWRVPAPFDRNTPQWVASVLAKARAGGWISDYPFGSDFTPEELILAPALAWLQQRARSRSGRLALAVRALFLGDSTAPKHRAALARMGLENPSGIREWLQQRTLCLAIRSTTAATTATDTPSRP